MGNPAISQKRKTQRLMQGIVEKRARREQALAQTKWYQERLRLVSESPRRMPQEMWCVQCQRDFTCVDALKMVTTQRGVPCAYYEGQCPQKHRAIRYLTDKHLDPYYHLSAMLRHQRHQMRDDILTPADPRFRIVYPKQWAKIEEEREAREQKEALENEQLYG